MSGPSALLRQLDRAGVDVYTWPGWETRGGTWANGAGPDGVMQHHTAPPVPFPLSVLAGEPDGRIRCNVNTKADGAVWLVAYRAPNYSSGSGSAVLLDDLEAGRVPEANAYARGLTDTTNGNPHFWGFENDHRGDGGPLPEAQRRAIVATAAIVLEHFGLPWWAHISHAEWTRRKFDPYWDGDVRAIEPIREGTRAILMGTYRGVENVPTKPDGTVADWARKVIDWGVEAGMINLEDSTPEDWNRPLTYGGYWTQEWRMRQ